MGELKTELSSFDLTGFIDKIFDFMRRNEISLSGIVYFSEDGDLVELDVEEINQDSILNYLSEGKIVFMPFSDINVGDPIPCADGNQYLISDSSDLDEEVAIPVEQVESVGYLLQVEAETLKISPAVLKGGDYYEIDFTEDEESLRNFREPMRNFINGFRKEVQ